MTLHEHRPHFERFVTPLASWCVSHRVGPNALTLGALVLTLAAAAALFLSGPTRLVWLVVGSGLLGIAALFDLADGTLARMTGEASPLGDYLDHVFDRVSDVGLLLGLAFSPWMPVEIGLFAIVGTLLTSYMGTQGQAVGVGRNYGGLMGRADRLFLLIAGPLAQVALSLSGYVLPFGLTVLYLVVAWIAVAGNITAAQRFWVGYRELSALHAKPK